MRTSKAQLRYSPIVLPTLAPALKLWYAQMIGTDVAPHAIEPVNHLLALDPAPPLSLWDETLTSLSRPLDAPTKPHHALVERRGVRSAARHGLL